MRAQVALGTITSTSRSKGQSWCGVGAEAGPLSHARQQLGE